MTAHLIATVRMMHQQLPALPQGCELLTAIPWACQWTCISTSRTPKTRFIAQTAWQGCISASNASRKGWWNLMRLTPITHALLAGLFSGAVILTCLTFVSVPRGTAVSDKQGLLCDMSCQYGLSNGSDVRSLRAAATYQEVLRPSFGLDSTVCSQSL